MSGLLRRLTRRHPATADETGTATPESSETAGASADTPAEPGGESPVPATESGASAAGDQPGAAETKPPAAEVPEATPGSADDQATQVLPATGEQPAAAAEPPAQPVEQPTVAGTQPTAAIAQPAPLRDMPAGIDPSELADAPIASARRGKLRRRLRYLRAVRDLLLRDLGGFTYEIQRSAGGTAQETHKRLIEAKTNRIAAVDTEVRGLEGRLGEPHGGALLREPGIGGTCPECGEIHASDAHYCARCGAPLDAKARARRDAAVAAAVHPTTSSHDATPEPAPASVLWAAGPRPDHKPEPEDEEDTQPSVATSQWLALRPHTPAEKDEEPAAKAHEQPARAETPATKAEEQASMAEAPAAAVDEPAAKPDEAAAAVNEPAAKADQPAAKPDEPAEADGPAPKSHALGADGEAEAATPDAGQSERAAAWLGTAKPADEVEKADAPAPQTVAAKRAGAKARASDQGAAEAARGEDPAAPAAGDEVEKPKRPRTPRAKKPVASGEEAPAKPKRPRAKKPAPAPEFAPEPNGRRDDPVTPPHGDPLTSRPDQSS